MTGQSLKVANVSAQKIVSNLDENDYVAVAHVSSLQITLMVIQSVATSVLFGDYFYFLPCGFAVVLFVVSITRLP